METLAQRVWSALEAPGAPPDALAGLTAAFARAYALVFRTARTRAPDPLDEYPELSFAPPPHDFEPSRLRVENRGLMNALAIPRPSAVPRRAPAGFRLGPSVSAASETQKSQKSGAGTESEPDLGPLARAPGVAGPVVFPRHRVQLVA